MKRIFLLVLCLVTYAFLAVAQASNISMPPKPPQKKQIVTAAQANGVYRYYKSEFRILALGHNKLKVQFDGVYTTRAKSINMGYDGLAHGITHVDTLRPGGVDAVELHLQLVMSQSQNTKLAFVIAVRR